ncbi:fatty acyl-CoA hydrolase precursor, medium chain-like [Babylonia areolata]|uniref:fatty acyl-CoA hydrolase precursor, medium chain-like n=1 Tax=Babylonia areolata TaxID=304850 RepID=UPI003FD44D1F
MAVVTEWDRYSDLGRAAIGKDSFMPFGQTPLYHHTSRVERTRSIQKWPPQWRTPPTTTTAVILLCGFLLLPATIGAETVRVNVTTPLGEIVGTEETHTLPDGTESTLWIFRGIPYAAPPVGPLRFSKPRPALPFSRPLEAFRFGPACPQRQVVGNNMSEDCLHLNIFVPKPSPTTSSSSSSSENASFPVVVWLHGGAFVSGEGRQLPGESLASYGKVVVVTLNFRIGALGFLSTDDEEAAGNWGLWDQRLALQWIHRNVAHFRGDPEKVTLAGTTSGAFCVTYHALYPPNRGLFQRIIVESGTGVSSSGYRVSGSLDFAEALGDQVGCKIPDADRSPTKALVACLREKDAGAIASARVRSLRPFRLAWLPVVDGDFVVKDPSAVLSWPPSSGLVPSILGSVDALVGTTSSDGSIIFSFWVTAMASAMNESVDSGVSSDLFEKVVEAFVDPHDYVTKDDARMVRQAVVQEYRTWEPAVGAESRSRGRDLVDLFTDQVFFIPSVVFTRNHRRAQQQQQQRQEKNGPSTTTSSSSSTSSTYMYQFHQGSPAPDPFPWMSGSLHKDHDVYVLGLPEALLSGITLNLSTAQGAAEWRFSQRVMTYWSNFVKTGNPNRPESLPVEWPPFSLLTEDYLHLEGAERTAARRRCRPGKTSFWLDFIPEMLKMLKRQRDDCSRTVSSSTARGPVALIAFSVFGGPCSMPFVVVVVVVVLLALISKELVALV